MVSVCFKHIIGAAVKAGRPCGIQSRERQVVTLLPRFPDTYLGIAKVEIDGFGMSNMQDSIGFWREPGTNLR